MKYIDLIRSAVKKSGLTQNELSDKTGIDRSHLSKIFSGSRTLNLDKMILILNALNPGTDIKKQIIDLYISESFGTKKYEKYIYGLSNINSYRSSESFYNKSILDEAQALITSRDAFGAYIHLLFDSDDIIRTNLPLDIINRMFQTPRKSPCYILYNENDLPDNFNVIDKYKLHKIGCEFFSSKRIAKDIQFPYQYFLVTADSVLFYNSDTNTGLYLKNQSIANNISHYFTIVSGVAEKNTIKMSSALDYKNNTRGDLKNKNIDANLLWAFPVESWMDEEHFFELANDAIPNKEFLAKVAYEHYSGIRKAVPEYDVITTIRGLEYFVKTGTTPLLPLNIQKSLSIQSRIKILQNILEYIESGEGSIVFLRPDSDIIGNTGYEMFVDKNDPKSASLRILEFSGEKDTDSYSDAKLFISNEPGLCSEFYEFFRLFAISDKVCTKDESINIIKDAILNLQYMQTK